jgi:nitric oxide reductase subunit C
VKPWREFLFALLVATYAAVSVVAYSDHPRQDAGPVLTNLERAGLDVWRANNCQACHQLYGFGGFLGPDLTNLVDDTREDAEFRGLLTEGFGKMPALRLSPEDQTAVLAFLRAMNRTGQSVATPLGAKRTVPASEHWRLLAAEWERAGGAAPGENVKRGRELFAAGCGSCHLPLTQGLKRAPDMTVAAFDRSPAFLGEVLANGRRTMPRFDFTEPEVADLAAWLDWTAANRARLVELNDALLEREGFSWKQVPWWEFR